MAELAELLGKTAYLDTNIFVYAIVPLTHIAEPAQST